MLKKFEDYFVYFCSKYDWFIIDVLLIILFVVIYLITS